MIVNVSSISGVLAPSTMSSLAYGTAKAALIYMTKGLAVAMAPKVRVNCVAPAFTDTPWMSQHFGADYQQVISKASAGYPLLRIATPEDIAGVKLRRRYKLDAPKGVRGRNSDNTRIRGYLGWEPSTPLAEGLEKTYAWIHDELTASPRSSRRAVATG